LSRQADNSDQPSTLPLPELNPLINPILGQNMGRWAEVYFTSPPEKRDQAVLELLRELEAEGSPREERTASPTSLTEQVTRPRGSPTYPPADSQPKLVTCQSCRKDNPAHQKFCGMCGARLPEEPSVADPQTADLRTVDLPQTQPAPIVQSRESALFPPEDSVGEPPPMLSESPMAQFGRKIRAGNDNLRRAVDSARFPDSYRLYVGTALALLIVALVCIAWRGTHAASGSSQMAPQALPAVTAQPAPSAQGSSVQKADASRRNAPSSGEPVMSSNGATKPVRTNADAVPGPDKATQATPLATTTLEKKLQTQTGPGNGTEELAIAQSYLDGTDGKERNSEEAVAWLWKAVAKRNADATLRLSDLYLKGDGVPKNCDQARVLLDAAALRGIKAAGERLRRLQSFGCE